jgi:glyoxylase-like metal-dependent hydrolase (beta-lactamase superfamily II)
MTERLESGLPVADRWFTSSSHPDSVTQIVEPHVDPFLRANVWHVRGSERDLVVDTGMGLSRLRAAFPELFEREPIVFVTHGHYDHTGGAHEFADVRCHAAEVEMLEKPEEATLITAEFGEEFAEALALTSDDGVAPDYLVDAVPRAGYDVAAYYVTSVNPSPLHDGDRISLGDRSFEVIHLPGHTPGSAGLLEADTGILFTGDVVYDGPLLDELPESNIPDYVSSMRRLAKVQPNIVHAGHDPSFDGERLHELIDAYLAQRG